MTTRRTTHELLTRQISFRAEATAAARTIEATIATENAVPVYDGRSGRVMLEILFLGGVEMPPQVPLLTDHSRAVTSMVGSVADFRVDGGSLLARLRFAAGNAAADDAWSLVDQRHLRAVSVGYRILESREIQPGRSEVVAGKSYTAPADEPLRVVTRWRLHEVSLVPIGADAAAMTRSSAFHDGDFHPMPQTLSTAIGPRNLSSMRWPEYLAVGLRSRGQTVPDNDADTCRAALSSVAGAADLSGLVNAAILTGFRQSPDTTAGWARAVELPNFLAAEIATVTVAPRMERLARGEQAATVHFGLTRQGWRLARFAAQFVLDEQDFVDGRAIGVYSTALEQLGAAARRLIPDLVYSLLLSNAALDDGAEIFAAGRGNLATTALADTSLDAGVAAVGNQVLADDEAHPVHTGQAARYLIVPPDLYGPAKRLARDMATGLDDLIVRGESRIGTAGLLRPDDAELLTGSATNWLLACPSDQAPGVVVGFLDGRAEPRVRQFMLSQGEWGAGFDVTFDLAATVLQPAALYWSTGAAE